MRVRAYSHGYLRILQLVWRSRMRRQGICYDTAILLLLPAGDLSDSCLEASNKLTLTQVRTFRVIHI